MSLDYHRLPMDYQSPKDAWRRIGGAVNWMLNNLSLGADTGVVSYGAQITDDAGDGTPHGDLNATDFTGHPYVEGDSLRIRSNAVVTFGHKAIAYLWTGPSDVLVGGTQSGKHVAVASDLTPIGTADHNLLVNRTQPDQHPQSAVTSLVSDQQTQDNRLNTLEIHPPLTNNPHQVTHDQLVGISPEPDPHPIYQKKLPGMILAGTTDSFTLNTTDSKLVNYTLDGETHTTGAVNPVTGEITVPSNGVYQLVANVLGLQGNDTKEEWIELKLDVATVDPERYVIGFLDVTTDKTSTRQVVTIGSRSFLAGQVLSLYLWASADLGTFMVTGVSFELQKLLEVGSYRERP